MKLRNIMSLVLAVAILVNLTGFAAAAEPEPGVIEIRTAEQLDEIRNDVTGHYRLMNDIDLSDVEWVPIGYNATPFVGILDGNGYMIRNLSTNFPLRDYVGLFGRTDGTIKNLGLVNANIRGGPSVGAFAGSNRGTITNCFVGGLSSVYGEGYVGGMVGYNSGSITKSYSTGHVNGIGYVGGLVGGNNSKIDQCYVTGIVQTTDSYIGGLSGFVSGDANYIRNSFFGGTLLCSDYSKSGGLVARILSGSVENCYSVSLSPNGLNGDGVPVNSYFDSDVGYADKPEARTTDQMMSQSTYTGWDFNSIWTIEEGQGYPYLRGVTKPDWTPPVISDTVPRNGDILGLNPVIRVFAEDDADLLDVCVQYEADGEWRDIGRSAASGKNSVSRFSWRNGSYSSPTVNVRFYAVDKAGNIGPYSYAVCTVKNGLTDKPVVTAVPGDMRIELSIEPVFGGVKYRLYRAEGSEDRIIATFSADGSLSHTDHNLDPNKTYGYYAEVTDADGNISTGDIVYAVPVNRDSYPPAAMAGYNFNTIIGVGTRFDGSSSTDNVGIASYTWDFGDGNTGSGAEPVNTYSAPGVYTARLKTTDFEGNIDTAVISVKALTPDEMGTLELRVLDRDTGLPIQGASVYAGFPDTMTCKTGPDGKPNQTLRSASSGEYNVSAYIKGYMPAEKTFEMTVGETTEGIIYLEKGEVAVGEMTVKQLSLQEIEAKGIDISNPANWNVFNFEVKLVFQGVSLPKQSYTVNGSGGFWGGSGWGGGGGGIGYGGGVLYPKTIPSTRPDEPPTLAFLNIPGKGYFLKDFFEISLIMHNDASSRFALTTNTANITLPAGLSLADTYIPQKPEQSMDDIGGGDTAAVSWLVRGDEPGTHQVDTHFNGYLMPFEELIEVDFEANIVVNDSNGLVLYVYPEHEAYEGQDYKVRYELKNESPRAFNKLHFEFGGDVIERDTLLPGEMLTGTLSMVFSSGTGKQGLYYQLINAMANANGIQVIIVWNAQKYGQLGSGYVSRNEVETCVEDPVDIVNGNLTWEYTDFELYGPQRLSFTRYYNSQSDTQTTLSRGWRHSFDYALVAGGGGARVTIPNGHEYAFIENPDGSYTPAASGVTLEAAADGYVFVLYDGTRVSLNADGRPTEISDITENKTTLTYDGIYLKSVTNKAGTLYFTYTGGRITSIRDDFDRAIAYEYDRSGNLIKFTNTDGDSLGYKYNAEGNLTEVSDFNGNVYMKNTYISGQVVEQYLADQGTSYFKYDPEGRTTRFTNAGGETLIYHYDENYKITHVDESGSQRRQAFTDGNLTLSVDNLGNETRYEYDGAGNRTRVLYPDGTEERFEYNAKRQVTKITARDGSVTEYTYDARGNLTSEKDTAGGLRRFEYDDSNNLIRYTDAAGAVTSYTYDASGNRTSMTDALGNTTQYEYDTLGRLVSEITPKGEKTQYEYTLAGKLTKIIDPAGNEQVFDVNGNGYNTGVTDPEGNTTTTDYNKMNNPISVTDPEGGSVGYKYDAMGNMTEITDALGNVTKYTYDYKGRMLSSTDPNGNTWRYEYDKNGQLVKTLDPYGDASVIAYDSMGRPTVTTNGRNAATAFAYDALGRVTAVTDALGGITRTVYDSSGNIISATDAKGNTWLYSYDAENRLVKSVDPLLGETLYEYDLLGRLLKTTTPGGSVTASAYDANGQLVNGVDPLGNVYENVYDSLGRLIQSKNPDGTSVFFEYDKNGRLIRASNADGNATAYVYDKNGRVLSITDAMGGVTSYVYDANGQVLSETNAMGGVTAYEYDKNGNVLSITDAEENQTVYAYDKLNRVASVTDAVGGVTSFTYDANGNITQITDAESYTTSFVYDLLDRLISTTDAEGNTVTNTYDANGNLISITDARGNTATFVYDALDRPTQVIDPAGGVVTSEYDSDGREIKVIDQEGAETSYEYDLNGRIVKMTDALGNETRFEYDSMDRVIRTIDAKDAVTSYTYTKTGLVETITDALGGVTRHTYDALGRVIAETNQNGETTTYTYDALGRVLSVSDPLGNTESLTYDALGRIVAVTDQKGVVKRYGYDPNGNVISSTDASGITSYFEYDKMNRLVKLIVNGKDSHVTLYEYDGRGLVTKTVNALGDDKVFVYDQNGNLVSETDEDGNVTTYTYDARDLVESINYAGGKSVTYRYDKTGNLVQMDDWTGQTSFTRDLLGRITQVNDQNSRVTGYEYDAVGNQSRIDYPDSTSVTKTYDALNRLTAVTDADGSITYTYDPAGHVKSMAFPNGISELYDYDLAGRLIEMTQKNPDGTTKMLNRFTYDPVGNVIKSEGVGYGEVRVETINSTYNELNQLMTRKVWSAVGRLINDITYTYDKRGNLIEAYDAREDKTTTYTYDGTNKMVRGVNGDDEVSEYTYNGLGILVGRSATNYRGTVVTEYVVDYTSAVQNNLMAYGSDGISYRYAYGVGLSKISVKVTTPSDVRKLYIQSDRLGSGRYATDATGVQVAYSFVDVWGLPVDFKKVYVGSTSLKILDNFTNHDYDEILGIYYAKARFYDPVTMRFMAMDPIKGNVVNPQSMNLYIYVLNNPLYYIDPDGFEPSVIGHVYIAEGANNTVYVGSTAQELKNRIGKNHAYKDFITSPTTTVYTVEVTADLNVSASGKNSIRSARNEALRSAEQEVLAAYNDLEPTPKFKNQRAAATEANMRKWKSTHSVKTGAKVKTTLKIGAFAALELINIFNMYQEEKRSQYVYAPYILQDEGGIFTLQHGYDHILGFQYNQKYFKKYACVDGIQKTVAIDKEEFNYWKKEAHALWGYLDFWGNFVPGLLRPELPIVEIHHCSPWIPCPPDLGCNLL